MNFGLLRFGPWKVLLGEPNVMAFGNICLDIHRFLQLARLSGASLFLVRAPGALNKAIYELESPSVPILAQTRLNRCVWGGFWRLFGPLWKGQAWFKGLWRAMRRGGGKARPVFDYRGTDFRREFSLYPIPLRLSARRRSEALNAVRRAGLSPEARIVTLHVRESGYKELVGLEERPKDLDRSAKIESYFPAVDFLVSRGFTVVRIGDRTMTPVSRPGLIDLATAIDRTEALELWCIMNSRFMIAGDSGVHVAAVLTAVPTLTVNVTNVIQYYPLRSNELYILKRAQSTASGRVLSLPEMLTEDYLFSHRNPALYRHLDNTADDILEATREMVAGLETPREASAEQKEYKRLLEIVARCERLQKKSVALGNPPVPFLGQGWVGRAFAQRGMLLDAELAGRIA